MPTEWVRIRDTKNNTEATVSRARADQLVQRGGVEILTAPATDGIGRPLPAGKTTVKSKESTR